jgi:outer membrane protein TolC
MHARRVSIVATVALTAALARAEDKKPDARERFDAQIVTLLGRTGGLTAEEVAKKATATSLELEARQKDVDAALAGVRQAAVAYFPRLSLSASYTRESQLSPANLGTLAAPSQSTPPGSVIKSDAPLIAVPLVIDLPYIQTVFRVGLSIPVSDYLLRISQGYDAASHNEQAARLNEHAAQLKVATDAKVAYYTWVRARLQQVVAQAALEQAQEHLADIRPAYEVGSVSKADVLRFESQEASAQLLLERTQNASQILEERIRVAMHDSTTRPYEIGEAFSDAPPDVTGLGDPSAVFTEAAKRRLELQAVDAQVGTLDAQRRQARAGYFPRLDAVGDVTDANPNQRVFPPASTFTTTWSAGIQLSWTVNDAFVAGAATSAATARQSQVEAQKNALLDGLRTEIYQAVQDVRETQLALKTTARGLAASEESYRVRVSLFRAGRATTTELTDAEADLTRARLENLNARVDSRLARVRYLHVTGQDTAG